MNRFSTQQNGMTNSFFFYFGVYRVLEKSSSYIYIYIYSICIFIFHYYMYVLYLINIISTHITYINKKFISVSHYFFLLLFLTRALVYVSKHNAPCGLMSIN